MFLAEIDDRELRVEIRAILAQFEILSDARASSPGRSPRSPETPLGPPGFAGLSNRQCPPEERSLYEHFRWRFENAVRSGASRKTLYFLLWEAEKALRIRTTAPNPDNPRKALVLTRADEDALIRHVLADHEGLHSYKVHLDLDLLGECTHELTKRPFEFLAHCRPARLVVHETTEALPMIRRCLAVGCNGEAQPFHVALHRGLNESSSLLIEDVAHLVAV